jgi:hypothetical protein
MSIVKGVIQSGKFLFGSQGFSHNNKKSLRPRHFIDSLDFFSRKKEMFETPGGKNKIINFITNFRKE